MAAFVPLLFALMALPAIGIAAWLAKDARPASRGLSIRMALVGIVILLGALGLQWAGKNAGHVQTVVLVMVVAVNALALSMWWHARRIGNGKVAR